MNQTTIVILTILLMNIMTFFMYAIDKHRASKGKWRISERMLLTWSLFAPWGGFAGIRVMHHKTKHKKFTLCVPMFMVLHMAIFIGLVYYNLK